MVLYYNNGEKMDKKSIKGLLLLLLASVIWGFAFVAQSVGADSLSAFTFNATRYYIGFAALIPVILIFERHSDDKKKLRTTYIKGATAGAVLCIASYLQQVGIELTDSTGKCGFITGLYMILVPIIGIFRKRKTTPATWAGAVLGVAGLFFICMTGGRLTVTKGDIYLIACSLMYAIQISIIDSCTENIYPVHFSAVQFLSCAALNTVGALVFENNSPADFRAALIPLLYCGLMSVGVAYTLQVIGQTLCDPTAASIVMSTESLFSAIGGFLILNQRMTPYAILGAVLIFAGIILSQVRIEKKEKKT